MPTYDDFTLFQVSSGTPAVTTRVRIRAGSAMTLTMK